jgi:hypothetical protein
MHLILKRRDEKCSWEKGARTSSYSLLFLFLRAKCNSKLRWRRTHTPHTPICSFQHVYLCTAIIMLHFSLSSLTFLWLCITHFIYVYIRQYLYIPMDSMCWCHSIHTVKHLFECHFSLTSTETCAKIKKACRLFTKHNIHHLSDIYNLRITAHISDIYTI